MRKMWTKKGVRKEGKKREEMKRRKEGGSR